MISVSFRLIRLSRRVFVPVLLAVLVSSSAGSPVGYAQTASSQPPAPDTQTASTATAPDAQNEARLLSRTRQLIYEGSAVGVQRVASKV